MGEIDDFIKIHEQQRRDEQKELAHLLFQTASLTSRMVLGKQPEYRIMDEFEWLYTPEEHRAAKRARLDASLHVKETK